MSTDWVWDETLFAGAAAYYEQGRLPYPEAVAPALAGVAPRPGRLVDVGCGPGTLTLVAAPAFDQAVGIDADAQMIAEARRLAALRGIGNATFRHLRAERLPAGYTGCDVVTFAASFHWMRRSAVAAAVRPMLSPGGVVVHVDDVPPAAAVPLAHPAPPQDRIKAVIERYLGPRRRAGRYFRDTSPSGEDAVWSGAGFGAPQIVLVPGGRVLERTVDDVVAATFSMSYAAPHLFGDRVADFERDLRAELVGATASGRFAVRAPDIRLRAYRLAATS